MRTKAIVRKQDGRKLGIAGMRKLFQELTGVSGDADKVARIYIAWHAFRAGVLLAQAGRVAASDVLMFRLHLGVTHGARTGGPKCPQCGSPGEKLNSDGQMICRSCNGVWWPEPLEDRGR